MKRMILLLAAIGLALVEGTAATLSDERLAQLRFEQKLDASVSSVLQFRDETGAPVRLADYLGTRPVILVLGYYQCPMLCSLVLNGLVESLEDLKWDVGNQFEIINVSINPSEMPALAAAKKQVYLKRYGRAGAAEGWHFLTGEARPIGELAREVGFQFAFDAASGQYAHPSGLVILTPHGRVSRYLFGVTFSPREVFSALETASREQVSSSIRNLVLLCFHYNPIRGKYGPLIMGIVRVLGVATLLGLGWLVLAMARCRQVTALPVESSGRTGGERAAAPCAEPSGKNPLALPVASRVPESQNSMQPDQVSMHSIPLHRAKRISNEAASAQALSLRPKLPDVSKGPGRSEAAPR